MDGSVDTVIFLAGSPIGNAVMNFWLVVQFRLAVSATRRRCLV